MIAPCAILANPFRKMAARLDLWDNTKPSTFHHWRREKHSILHGVALPLLISQTIMLFPDGKNGNLIYYNRIESGIEISLHLSCNVSMLNLSALRYNDYLKLHRPLTDCRRCCASALMGHEYSRPGTRLISPICSTYLI